MAERRPDILAGLSAAARRRREQEDTLFLSRAPVAHAGTPEAAAIGALLFSRKLGPKLIEPYRPGEHIDMVICARVDLDHPIYFPDNRFADCTDCACRVQYRPDAPPGVRLCVCCGARRMREAAPNG